jgi:hypothetical protein
MKNITITRTKNIVNAPYLPYKAYTRALALATEHKGEIGKTAEGNFKATFANAKIAEKFVKAWTAEYEANRKVEPTVAPTHEAKPVSKRERQNAYIERQIATLEKSLKAEGIDPNKVVSFDAHGTPVMSAKASPRKARKAKGNGIDFNAFKGTKSEKNRALHAMLVSKGIADSRTPEYKAVWNARPWAK